MGRFLSKYVISDIQRISSQTRAPVHLDPCFLAGVLFFFVWSYG